MIRSNSIFSDKHPMLEHVFSSRKHFIFRSYQKDTLDTYLTKRIVVKDEKLLQYYKSHLYSNILPYLARQKRQKYSSLLLIGKQKGDVIVTSQEGQMLSFDDEPIQDDGNVLFISKLMIEGQSLRQMILNKDQRIDKQFCHDLVGTLVDFILGHGGAKNLFLTAENIIFEDCGYFHLNYFSLVGLDFWKMQKYITRAEIEEILPFLTQKMVSAQSSQRKVDLRMELKFIMLNFFGAFFKKDMVFQSKFLDLDVQVKITDENILKIVEKVENTLLPKILTAQMEEEIFKFDRLFKVDYLTVLKVALNDEKFKEDDINWEFILKKISKNNQKDDGEKSDVSEDQSKSKFEIYPLLKNEDRFSMNLFEFFDLYISLMELLKPHLEQLNDMKLKKKEDLLKTMDALIDERNGLMSQKRFSRSIFIPIKAGMNFSQILNYKNWIDMLNSATQTQTTSFHSLTNLIKFVIEVRQILVIIEPLITNKILKEAMSQKKCQEDIFNSSQSLYRYLQLLTKGFNPLIQDLDSPITLKKNLKCEFWRLSFWLLNELLLLIKRFFIKTTEHNLTSNIKIKRQDFSSIIMLIDDFIPPITVNDNSEE